MFKNSWILLPFLLACAGPDKDSESSEDGCNLGSDCSIDEFCMVDYREGASSDGGECMALPDTCDGPTTCDDCDLGEVACPESVISGCSDDMTGASNPIFSCS